MNKSLYFFYSKNINLPAVFIEKDKGQVYCSALEVPLKENANWTHFDTNPPETYLFQGSHFKSIFCHIPVPCGVG